MLKRIIHGALRQRLFVGGVALLLVVLGVRAFRDIPIEAFPDVQDVQTQVITPWPGHAAEEIEKQVTLPLERGLNGTPGLTNLRSTSIFGLSVVTMTFDEGTSDYFARQQTLERMSQVTVPNGVQPSIAPLSNSLGEIYRYTLRGRRPLTELKALEDWVAEPAYRSVPGVADVVSFGGAVKQYQIDVAPDKLLAYGVTLPQVEQAVANANANAGGGYLTHGYERQVVRGVGTFRDTADIGAVVVTTRTGVPVRVGDLGRVSVGPAPREGVVAKDGNDDVVEGIVLMRKGDNALKVLEGVRAKTEQINGTLLPGDVKLVPFYDRAALVNHTVHTVEENLVTGALLVMGILVIFLGDWRAALVVGAVIPLSLLGAFILMDMRHVDANLISLGAVDFGLIVDAAVVMVEAFVVRLALKPPRSAEELEAVASPDELATHPHGDFVQRASLLKRRVLAEVTLLMGKPMIFSVACVVTAFVPIFTFQRVERRIFSPMAYTLTFTLVGSLLLSLTVIPVLASVLLRGHGHDHAPEPGAGAPAAAGGPPSFWGRSLERVRAIGRRMGPDEHGETPATRLLHRVYEPWLDRALRHPRRVVGAALVALIAALALGRTLGTEFLPALDEGNIWLTVTMPVGISLEQAKNIERDVRHTLQSYPEVTRVVSQLGRPDDGTDPKGPSNIEILADLKPAAQWPASGGRAFGGDKDALVADMARKLGRIPGIELNFSQYIKDNVEEALSGVKGELVVKIFGPDLDVLQIKADQVRQVIAGVPGVADLGVEHQFGQPQIRWEVDRAAVARYGLNVADVNDAIETAVGGKAVTQFLEGDRVFDVRVRFDSAARASRAALEQLAVNTPDGRTVPLASLAREVSGEGASRIGRESNERRIAVKCSVRGRDEGSFVAEAQKRVAQAVSLPAGYHMTWGGQFENQRRATARLMVIVPASIVLIFVLLFSAFGSVRWASLILANLPFALIGGILVLSARHIHLSVSAAVGFIALFGIAVQNGILLVAEFNRLTNEGMPVGEAVRRGALDRLRPVTMTALMAALGLLPAALSHGVGAETTRPFASVIVGGLATSTVLTLLLLPVLYRALYREQPWEPADHAGPHPGAPVPA